MRPMVLISLPLLACTPQSAGTPAPSTTRPVAIDSPHACDVGQPRGLEVGDCAPESALPDRTGEPVQLSSFRGRLALVDISAIW